MREIVLALSGGICTNLQVTIAQHLLTATGYTVSDFAAQAQMKLAATTTRHRIASY